jgi:hypothetical protein
MSESQTVIEGHAIIELFGHNKIAGYVTTAIIGTSGMLRVDVPESEGTAPFPRFYGPGAIYSLTLVTEDVMLLALKEIRPRPVTVYIPRQLPEPSYDHTDYQYDEDDGEEDDREGDEEVEDEIPL